MTKYEIKEKYFGGMSSAISLDKVMMIDFIVRSKRGFKIKRGSKEYKNLILEYSAKAESEIIEIYKNI